MKSQTLITLSLFLLIAKISTAQTLNGNWKGTSLCQVKSSPCRDEIVVYHISKNNGNNSYRVSASKIIDEKEDAMGTIDFLFDPKQKIFYSIDSVQQVKWEFKVTDKEMHGTLTSRGKLFRIVDLKKED